MINRIEAEQIYIDYHCYGNRLHTSADTMGEIVYLYHDKLPEWQAKVNKDDNQYEFDDSDFENWKADGEQKAKNATGYENSTADKAGDCAHVAGDIASAALGVGFQVAAYTGKITAEGLAKGMVNMGTKTLAKEVAKETAKEVTTETVKETTRELTKTVTKKGTEKVLSTTTEKTVQKGTEEAVKTTTTELTSEGAKGVGDAVGFIIGCTLGAATAAAYWAKQPNKEGKEACDKLFNELLPEQNGELAASQSEMESMAGSIQEAQDEAITVQEQAAQEIEDKKTKYDAAARARASVKSKASSGANVTTSDKSTYKSASVLMAQAGAEIEGLQGATSKTLGGIQSDMETYQEGYDTIAENIATTQGITDYAEGLDKMTQIMCYVEGGVQTLNAASSAYAAYEAGAFAASGTWAFGATAWAWAFVALGGAGAIASIFAAKDQFKWAGEVGNEITMRERTQGFNDQTLGIYEAEIDNYEIALSGVSELELEKPDDLEAPTDMELTVSTQPHAPTGDVKKQKEV